MKRPNRHAARGLTWGVGVLLALAPSQGQNQTKSAPARTPGFVFPYKKGNVMILRVSGDEARAISLTLHEVKGFRLETFNADGTPNLIGEAPTCLFNLTTTNASSSGPITITQMGDGFSLSGEGFNWNHASQRLQLSNKVHAVFSLKSAGSALSLSPPK